VADTPQDFAASVTRLLESPGLRESLAHAAREQIARAHDWAASMAVLDELLLATHPAS
jgi:hypothetical protein